MEKLGETSRGDSSTFTLIHDGIHVTVNLKQCFNDVDVIFATANSAELPGDSPLWSDIQVWVADEFDVPIENVHL